MNARSCPADHRSRRIRAIAFAGFFAALICPSTGADDRAVPRLPRENLLVYRGADGLPKPVKSPADWLKRRAEILEGMQSVMGRLPGPEKRVPLDMKVEEEVDCGSFIRRLITYTSEPGSRVPAYLSIPKALLKGEGRKAPGILCLHGTDNVIGHGTVVGLGERPNRAYASELAERGYVTLAPNYPLLAKYQPDIKALGWESGTLKAVWDNIRGLDLLESLPFVSSGGFGAIGHSLGGHNSVYTAVFDDRIKAVVSSCGLDSFLDYYQGDEKVWMPEKGWTQTRYMPRLAGYRGRLDEIPFDFHELLGALAPRDVLIVAPVGDSNFRAESVDRVVESARAVYNLLGHPERIRLEHPEGGHDFPGEMRQAAYALFDSVLIAARNPVQAEPETRWTDARELTVEGKGWSDTKEFYDRLPSRAEGVVRPPVWGLSRDSAGYCIRFATDSPTIQARWTLRSDNLAMPHMPATGVSGLDLYTRTEGGPWQWLGVGQPREFPTNTATLARGLPAGHREYLLYLPLYNGVSSVEIGVPEGNSIEPPGPRPEGHRKPIVFYGTSITQGGCASRPGMVHTAILGRRLDRPVINLGFSGSGRMEPEMAKFLAELDPAVYVLDCLPNMNAREVEERVEPTVRTLRAAHPETPIVLAEDRNYTNARLLPERARVNQANHEALKAAHDRLVAAGVGGLHYLNGASQLGEDGEDTVDGSHPTDLGFSRMADAFEAVLKPALGGATEGGQ
ncbi:SGNH/GDSL hydrolase family protein [Tundrisphaera lichenicola]|uniref:SGNH/GDSL hydrolase family protein n=1 Tax=Tundrisphaera lichenicola TaxID=2029860 RepID=UPI003EBA0DC5